MTEPLVGAPLRRLEDPRLITGGGRFVDDLAPPGLLHAAFVRSVDAHATITGIEVAEAAAAPGVIGVFRAADLGLDRPMPNLFPAPLIAGSVQASPLATHEVCHAGEPIAVVVAASARQAVDAAGLVGVTTEPLPAVVDHERALDPDAPAVHTGADGNLVARLGASFGDVERVFAGADRVVEIAIRQHRGACASMEPRGVLATRDVGLNQLIVWSSTQSPYPLRRHLSDYLGLALEQVRVIAPDVGGGFGPKAALYAEEYVVAALAQRLGKPVKWIETRREHFLATLQQRDQSGTLRAAVTSQGRIRGLTAQLVHDNGAYVPYGLILPVTGIQLMNGPYRLDALDVTMDVVYTNKPPTNPIRGAGRPYAVFAVERLVDAVATELGLDRVAVRMANFVPADAFPYEPGLTARDGSPVAYDSGDYHASMNAAVAAADLEGFPERRAAAESAGRLRGWGVASYVEDTGLGPFEGADIEILPSGDVVVDTGAASQGQGHATVFAQICADHLGVDPTRVTVRSADTGHYGYGISTAASRTAVTAGSSVHLAAAELAARIRQLAAERFEAAPADIVLAAGRAAVAGQPDASVGLGELADSMQGRAATPLPGGRTSPGLRAAAAFQLPGPAFAFGTHIAEVEVDPDTGHVSVERYTVAHDCGTILNPMIVDGQIDGGVAHGLGNALSERVVFGDDGQPLVTTFMDYRIMSAVEMPALTKVHTVTPAPGNPLGAKGAGEGGTLPAAAAVASAVEHALEGHGVFVDRHPLTPETVYGMLHRSAPNRTE